MCNKVRGNHKRVQQVEQKEELEELKDSDLDSSIYRICKINSRTLQATIVVKINNKKVRMEFDSGARVSTINSHLWKKLGRPTLKPIKGLTAYENTPLKVLGEVELSVSVSEARRRAKAAVIDTKDVPLFGLSWVLIFRLKLPEQVEINAIQEERKQTLDGEAVKRELARKYPDVILDRLGCIKTGQAQIEINKNIEPKRYAARRVPYPLQQGVQTEIYRLLEENITEQVDPEITSILWATPTVNVLRKGGGVCICGDFKVTVNTAIVKDQHILPTFDDIIMKVTERERFSIIDLKDAYVQMPVRKEDRELLTISTHLGFFRYKWLPFGLSTAPAIFFIFIEKNLKRNTVYWFYDRRYYSVRER